jgi:hypothetical protein
VSTEATTRARARALQTARVVTLGLALAGTAAGCDFATDTYCHYFPDNETCCLRLEAHVWNASTHRCETPPMPPFVGPMVPPS